MIYRNKNNKTRNTILALVLVLSLGGIIFYFRLVLSYDKVKSENSQLVGKALSTENKAFIESSDRIEENQPQDSNDKAIEALEEYNIPIIVIELPAGKTLKDLNEAEDLDEGSLKNYDKAISTKYPRVKIEADISIYNKGYKSGEIDNINQGNFKVIDEKIMFGLRGQSSLSYPKKQFAVNFIDEEGNDKEVSPLGMSMDNSFVLNGSYVDNSAIRNYLAYKISDEIMGYSPEVKYSELYILDDNNREIGEGTYQGVYLFMEKNTRGKNRIDIKKNSEMYKDFSFIISRDKSKFGDTKLNTLWSTVQRSVIVKADGVVFDRAGLVINYPKSDVIKDEEIHIIENYINEFEYDLYSSDFQHKTKGYRKYVDIDSFVSYAIINEVFNNTDGGDVSTFFYKDIGGKITAGPVWDFDLTLGNTITSEVPTYDGFRMYNTLWYDQLFKDPYFVNKYIAKYKDLRKNSLSIKHINKIIDVGLKELGPALERNNNRWYTSNVGYKEEVNPYHEIDEIRNYFKLRCEWIDKNTSILLRKDYE